MPTLFRTVRKREFILVSVKTSESETIQLKIQINGSRVRLEGHLQFRLEVKKEDESKIA